jgi:hypothetical protein
MALHFQTLGDVLGPLRYSGSCPCGRQYMSTHDRVVCAGGFMLCEHCGLRAITTSHGYTAWRHSYVNEDFDRNMRLAIELTDADRRAGKVTVDHGYSQINFAIATIVVCDARIS